MKIQNRKELKPISNQNFYAFIEKKGFERNIDFIRTTETGIDISIKMNQIEKDEWIPKLLLDEQDIINYKLFRLRKGSLIL